MSSSMRATADSQQGNPDVLGGEGEDKNLVPRCLRLAIVESGWKDGAVAEAIGLKGASGAAYFSKMLSGDKPISERHLRALPTDVRRAYARRYAKSFGLIVVEPVLSSLERSRYRSVLRRWRKASLPSAARKAVR